MNADVNTNSMESLTPQQIIDCRLEDCCKKRRMRSASAAEVMNQNNQTAHAGWISVIGRRREMEDAVAVAEFGAYNFFAVYNGHGGSAVANACKERLHHLLEEEVEGKICSLVNWEKAMAVCFRKMDEEVAVGGGGGGGGDELLYQNENEMTVNTVGSMAVVVVVGRALLVVANCGDSRAVLCRDGTAVPLSRDHKPDRADEKERSSGGSRWKNYQLERLCYPRSACNYKIDRSLLKPDVISEPEVTVWDRTESDSFLIIASHGLWCVVSNELACELVRGCFEGRIRTRFSDGISGNQAAEVAALLAELAIARGSKDNISVVVVDLNK